MIVFVVDDNGVLLVVLDTFCGQSWYRWEEAAHEKHSSFPLECWVGS